MPQGHCYNCKHAYAKRIGDANPPANKFWCDANKKYVPRDYGCELFEKA